MKKIFSLMLAFLMIITVFLPGIQFKAQAVTEDELDVAGPCWPLDMSKMIYISCQKNYSSGVVHNAIDFAAPSGTEVYAAYSGTVYRAGWDSTGFGNHVRIKSVLENGETIYIYYAHFVSPAIVKEGDYVKKGQLIGYVGSTGNSSGPHLHFQVNPQSNSYKINALDPHLYLPLPDYKNDTRFSSWVTWTGRRVTSSDIHTERTTSNITINNSKINITNVTIPFIIKAGSSFERWDGVISTNDSNGLTSLYVTISDKNSNIIQSSLNK